MDIENIEVSDYVVYNKKHEICIDEMSADINGKTILFQVDFQLELFDTERNDIKILRKFCLLQVSDESYTNEITFTEDELKELNKLLENEALDFIDNNFCSLVMFFDYDDDEE